MVVTIGLPLYLKQQNIPRAVAVALGLEAALYLGLACPELRDRLRGSANRWLVAVALAVSGMAPYLLAGLRDASAFALLSLIVALICFWFLLLPRSIATGLGYLAMLGVILLWRMSGHIYGDPYPKLPLSILGELMITRLFVMSVLVFRGAEGVNLGFIPTRAEWLTGLRQYLYFLPLGLVLNMQIDFADPRHAPMEWWRLLVNLSATFLGMYVFVALREEVAFRGLLQQWLGNGRLALAVTSVTFGLVHLPFRQFPNWKFVALATLAGWFYGRAFQQGGGVRAAMVTHALVNTTWRTLMQ